MSIAIFICFLRSETLDQKKKTWLLYATVWSVGYYLINAFVLQMVERHYHFVYMLFCILGGWGMAELSALPFFTRSRLARFALIALTFCAFTAEDWNTLGKPDLPSSIVDRAPSLQSPADLKMTVAGDRRTPEAALLMGISSCGYTPAPWPSDPAAQEKFRLPSDYLLCPKTTLEKDACAPLRLNGRINREPESQFDVGDLGSIYRVLKH